jgi:hypothetical protein
MDKSMRMTDVVSGAQASGSLRRQQSFLLLIGNGALRLRRP